MLVQICPKCGGIAFYWNRRLQFGDAVLAADVGYKNKPAPKPGDQADCEQCGANVPNGSFKQTTYDEKIQGT